MDEGISAGANVSAPGRLNNQQSKLAVRRVHRKKTAALGQLQKKLNKGKKQGKKLDLLVTSSGIDDDEEHKCVHHDWQSLVLSSTSATESAAEEYKKKVISNTGKKKKKGSNKSCFNDFVEYDSLKSTPFVFQRRLSRIDWRKLHTIDVDKIIREADVGTLGAILDTIAFSDIQGEDTRNFTEANFIKIFRLAQLMVEYLLHVQELLSAQRSQLLANETMIERRLEKYKERFAKIVMDLTQSRHDLKQAKKTLRIYEAMLKVQGENQQQQMQQQQSVAQHMVRCCPLCDKMFESSYYLDLHVARRHPKANDVAEEKILAVVSKAEEATAARVKAETTAALQTEIQHLRSISQVEIQRTEAAAQFQIATLQASLRDSNSKVQEVQNKLEQLQTQLQISAAISARNDANPVKKEDKDIHIQEKLKELDHQLQGLQKELKIQLQEKKNLTKELASAKSEVSWLKRTGRDTMSAEQRDLQATDSKPIQDLETSSLPSTDNGQDRLMEDGYSSDATTSGPAGGNSKSRRTRREQIRSSSRSSVKKRAKEEKDTTTDRKKDHSSPQRKRKQRLVLDPNQRVTLQKPEATKATRDSDSAPPSPRAPKHIYESYNNNTNGDENSTLSKRRPELQEKGVKSTEKDIRMAAKADLEQDLARVEDKRLVTREVGNLGAIKKTKRETEKTQARQRLLREKEAMAREKRRLEVEKEKELSTKRTAEEEERMRLEIAAAASMDVGEDGPSIPIVEKEKWLEERPFHPIPQRPHVLSKFPHPQDLFESKRGALVNRLDEHLIGELRKFGFSSDTEGISDTIHQAAVSALEKQHKQRASALQANQKKSLEYERGAIVWHTQRAVRERDIQIIESHLEEESEETTSQSERAASPFTDDEEENDELRTLLTQKKEVKESRTPVTPQIEEQRYDVGQHYQADNRYQPNVFESNGPVEKQHSNYNAMSYSRKQLNRFKLQTQGNMDEVLVPSTSELFMENSTMITKDLHPLGQPEMVENKGTTKVGENDVEAAFGLGQWDSDEEMETQVVRNDIREAKESSDNMSEDESEESKIFKELDAEIDEIIRL